MYLNVTTAPSARDLATVRQGLSQYNVAKVPELLNLPDEEFLVVMRENGKIVAGTVCELDWGWLFFDVVWTSESVRGKGYGTLIMNAAETYALMQGVSSAYLMTTSFQARPFYEKLAYERYGFQEDRPPGHVFHYMRKTQLSTYELDPRITIEAPPTENSLAILDAGLLDEIAKTAPLSNTRLAVFLRDEDERILGGFIGNIFWNWCDLRFLWVDESVQGQGWGKKLLQSAENELQKHGCLGICCDTASFQSFPFYQSQGFTLIGTLENRPPQHRTHFIQKRF